MDYPSRVVFADESLKKAYLKLRSGRSKERDIFEGLTGAFAALEKDAYCGTKISSRLIPDEYRRKHKVTNLWKYDLPGGWRLIYTVKRESLVVLSIVLEWFPHNKYERRFGY